MKQTSKERVYVQSIIRHSPTRRLRNGNFVLEKFKEGKLNPERTIELIEMLYDSKTWFVNF